MPRPGFLPFWISLGIIAMGLLLAWRGIRLGRSYSANHEWPDLRGWTRIAVVVVALTLSILLLEPLGFLVIAVLFVATVAFGLGMRSWRVLAVVPLVAAIVLNGVFAVWLRVPLPGGILGGLH